MSTAVKAMNTALVVMDIPLAAGRSWKGCLAARLAGGLSGRKAQAGN